MNNTQSIVLAILAVIFFFSIGVYCAVRFVHFLNNLPSPRANEKQAPVEPPTEPAEPKP